MAASDPLQRHDIAVIGGLTRSSMYDSFTVTANARQAANVDRFLRKVDPDCLLPTDERARRATAARRAYMRRLALRSAQVRRERRIV